MKNVGKQPNELHREFLNVTGLNPYHGHTSSSRGQMFSSHITQTLPIKDSTERLIQTGMEREYGKYTFSVKIPGEAGSNDGVEIIKIIERYPSKIGKDAIRFNPHTIIIYENVKTKEVGIINLNTYCSYHQYFGFEYKRLPILNEIKIGSFIPAGTILLDSPSITEDGGYKYGRQMNMAFMTHPSVSEDGIMISRDVLDGFSFKTYETRVVEWGNKRFPLNLYGDDNNYKPFPDIGDVIRDDGILMCLRSYDVDLAVVEQNINDLRKPDFLFDKLTYAGGAGGRVIDIKVYRNRQVESAGLNMDAQADKYANASSEFYNNILDEYDALRKRRGANLQITPEFHRLIIEIKAALDNDQQRLSKTYRQAPLDEYRVEFVIQYDNIPITGNKLTDCFGGKGVVCHIAEPHEMPVDKDGNRADIVMDPNSTIGRMNVGRLIEQYVNASARDTLKKIKRDFNVASNISVKELTKILSEIEVSKPELFNRTWSYLLGFYKIVSPKMYVWFTDGEYQGTRVEHLVSIIKDNIYIYSPPDNDPETQDIISELETSYRPLDDVVSYIGYSGKRVTTKEPVLIGSMYILLLEKTGDDWTAVSSGKLQNFGVLSQITNGDKYSLPSRTQAIRALGESEVRILVSYIGADATADILDRNNNPAAHRNIVDNILKADKPTNVEQLVDRNNIPIGGSKPLQLLNHILECSGIKFRYRPYVSPNRRR